MSISRGFVKFDKETGLVVYGKQQILLDLINICKTSYGQDYTVDEGTEMYAFLDNLAFALAETGSAVKSLYDAFGFTMATGTPLDVLCSLAGISRKQGETDTALRARYFQMLYTPSVSTLDGLKAKLMEATIVNGVGDVTNIADEILILNNSDSDSKVMNGVTVNGHSILVVAKLNDLIYEGYVGQDRTDAQVLAYKTLSDIILKYKSLGCGVSDADGSSIIDNTEMTTYAYCQVVRSIKDPVTVDIKRNYHAETLAVDEKAAIDNQIKINIQEYINALSLGQDIMYSGIMCSIFRMYEQLGYTEDIMDISSVTINNTILTGDTAYPVSANKYARVTSESIKLVDTTQN